MTTYGIGYNHHTKGDMVQCAWEGCDVIIERWPKIRRYCPEHSVANTRRKTSEYHQRKRDERMEERSA